MTARIAVTLLALLSMIVPAGAVERILDFISDVRVERNGDLTVTETFAVQAEGQEIRRGIYRDFLPRLMLPLRLPASHFLGCRRPRSRAAR